MPADGAALRPAPSAFPGPVKRKGHGQSNPARRRPEARCSARMAADIRIGRELDSTDVIDVLSDLFILRGVPCHVRSDNGVRIGAI